MHIIYQQKMEMCIGEHELIFTLGEALSGKTVTIVQKNSDGTTETLTKTVDSSGKVTITTYELSSFMISINQDDIDIVLGDVNLDGKVNNKDWALLYLYINGTKELTEQQLLNADVNKDGNVNNKDWNRLYNHINEIDPLD